MSSRSDIGQVHNLLHICTVTNYDCQKLFCCWWKT